MKSLLDFFNKATGGVLSNVTRRKRARDGFGFHDFEKVVSISDLHSTGQVHLIGLDYIMHELGLRWFSSREDIIDNLERKIRQKTNDEDVFFSKSETEYLLVFSNKYEAEAQQLCGDILKELSITYLGTSYDHNIIIRTAIGKRGGKLLFKDVAYSSKSEEENIEECEPKIISSPKLEAFVSPIKPHKKRPFELIYKPIWDKRNNIVSTFMVSI